MYDAERDELIGASIPLSPADLSKEALKNMKAKFANHVVKEAIIFATKNGAVETYVSMIRTGKPAIVIGVNENGKAHYFGRK